MPSLTGQIIAESNSAGNITSEYVYLNGQPIAKMEGGNTYYYHNDHLATPQKMTDSTGTVVWAADYKPFGETTITVSTITNNLRFPGQYYDQETGLLDNYFRNYDPAIGRYKQADPIGQRGGLNPFIYVENNPVNAVDAVGLATTEVPGSATSTYNCMAWGLGITTTWIQPDNPNDSPNTIPPQFGCEKVSCQGKCPCEKNNVLATSL